jgi:mannosyltransferase
VWSAASKTALPAALHHFPHTGAWIVLLTVVGGLLRGFRIGANSLWVDEIATLTIVSLPFHEIAGAAADVNFCPPLYFWLVHGVVSWLGISESSLRLVSAVAGTLTVPVAWILARELTGSRGVAVLCAALLALNPLHIWYSQEARAYALLMWLGSGALCFLVLAARTKAVAHWAGFAACMTAVLLTHTTGPVILVVAWVWALLSPRPGALLRPLALTTLITGLITMPFALTVSSAVAQATGTHSPPRPLTGLEIPYTLLTYTIGYSFGPSMRDIQNLGPIVALRRHPFESAIGAGVAACLLGLMIFRPVPGRRYFMTLFVVPILVMLLGSAVSGKGYQPRYAIAGLLGYCGLWAGALRVLPPKVSSLGVAALVIVSLLADVQWYLSPEYWKDDSRAAVGWLTRHLPEESKIAVAPRYVTIVLGYYARLQNSQLQFVAADTGTRAEQPAALLLTRLHHVADAASLRARFRERAGPCFLEESVGGYQILSTGGCRSKRPH